MCGIFGIYGHQEAANMAYLGLHSLQHRGQESSGIVSSDGKSLHSEIHMGLVADIFSQERLDKLSGHIAIGHNRYSTTGASLLKNAQPVVVDYSRGALALAHNGNLVNASYIRSELEAYGSIFRSTMDTEVIVHLIAQSREDSLLNKIVDALSRVRGAYSLLIMTEDELIGIRDPYGFRPLCLGRLKDSYVLASETCAFDLIEASFEREIEPGEIVFINSKGIQTYKPFPVFKKSYCIFEFIYFARPDSNIFGENVNFIRQELGRQLAIESKIDADIVVPVPDSGVPAALGFSQEAKIPFEMGFIRSHYVGRTFIEPQQAIRHFGVKLKLNPVKKVIEGKRVVVIDDSIVRGTTSRKIVKMLRDVGAKEVHVRISSPPTTYPCFYGIDTPTRKELIAATHTIEETCKYLTADSLSYLSIEGMLNILKDRRDDFCTACFSGVYPVEFDGIEVMQLELF
ncbi:MAG: amidophosphoribosyltransferase [Nitrospinae bacterium RIFCSPLOWO2_02_FULL_39_110]|nr:MAG: amidophosphoribosyltransferase [Nitrospinae bacterium RIFCSPHIGHO2_02_39_11]OGV99422.1 MAG: amidophosphoribosyltransferase [Nitrospinae bacterium RIFCSPHIGHO2_12_FULL_39_42]OGW01030.1 MAG: amidophosphoribosyltransferase [Nitrospinae bacterium RIFCSPHIGHO2_02_FULL_39_82]OGW02694.1 MAG: amidophosphoribosyltransferase [Nitrospinae bacterium RIFCSPLOWO2_02_39_17]OGW05787.1 MAG: amidophosphoribosyltransferase [Nitrospinae bacterium RIFCSPLOWO2_02_FULL_39_110]OGW10774.1 MAG: amidophosphoribo